MPFNNEQQTVHSLYILKLVQLKVRPKNSGFFFKQRYHRRRQTLKPRDKEIQGQFHIKSVARQTRYCAVLAETRKKATKAVC